MWNKNKFANLIGYFKAKNGFESIALFNIASYASDIAQIAPHADRQSFRLIHRFDFAVGRSATRASKLVVVSFSPHINETHIKYIA